MRILTDAKISKIKNEVINKIYNALVELHEKKECEYHPNEDTIKCHKKDEIMDIVLKHFYAKPTGEKEYGWSNSSDLSNFL